VVATLHGTPALDAATSPLHGTVQIDTNFVATGAIQSASLTLVPRGGGTYAGSVALSYPPGGNVPVHVTVAGVTSSVTVPIDQPRLQIDSEPQQQVGTAATIPVCISASAITGTVSVHLAGATFAGGSAADTTATLLPGECGGAFTNISAPPWTIESHALLVVASPGASFEVSATLQGTAGEPDVTAPIITQVGAGALAPVSLALSASTTHATTGSIVTLQAHVLYAGTTAAANVPVAFASSPVLTIVPSPATTNASGIAGASFAMPDLGGGSAVIYATVGSASDAVTIVNGP
jgi:hypothetical protein